MAVVYSNWNSSKFVIKKENVALTTNFSLADPPSETLRGQIATMSGTVNWLSRTASKPVTLTSPRAIQQGEEVSTGKNGKTNILIKNDTSITLFPNSHINVIQLLPQNFVFAQDKGLVLYVNTINVPVSIRSYDLVTILARGVITIAIDSDNQIVTITVLKGTVREGFEDRQNTSNVVTVNVGSKFIFDETTKEGTIE